MSTAILIVEALIALFVLLLLAYTLGLLRQVLALREYAGFVDVPRPVEYNAQIRLSDLPIPAVERLHDRERAAVLILSDRCVTCHDILQGVPAVWAENLIVLVQAHSRSDATDWLARYGQSFSDQVVYDEGRLLAAVLGVLVSPALISFEGDRPISAATVPSTRQLHRAVEWVDGVARVPYG